MQKEDLNSVLQIANYANSKFGPQNKFFLPKVHNIIANDDLKDIIDKFKQKYSDLENDGITVVCYGETSYPQKLIQLDNPPALLYCRGNVSLLNRLAIMEHHQLRNIVPFIYKCETRKNVEVSLPENFYIQFFSKI